MLCNTVQQDGVPLAWSRWNLFPYSLAEGARRWFALASFEVKGNWDDLMKKFCEWFFPLSKVQHIRKQVINFAQGEEEGIDQAWDRFNGSCAETKRILTIGLWSRKTIINKIISGSGFGIR